MEKLLRMGRAGWRERGWHGGRCPDRDEGRRQVAPRLGGSNNGNCDTTNIVLLYRLDVTCAVVVDRERIHTANQAQ